MKIETEFNINERVYFLYSDRIISGIVKKIFIEIDKDIRKDQGIKEQYEIDCNVGAGHQTIHKNKRYLFKSKEDLIKNLLEL